MTVDFTWGGRRHRLTSDEVVKGLNDVQLGSVNTHAVNVGGVLYPVKEAMAHLTGEDLLDFNTNQARAVFKKLGFEVSRTA